jgi:hypothetical protein
VNNTLLVAELDELEEYIAVGALVDCIAALEESTARYKRLWVADTAEEFVEDTWEYTELVAVEL